MVCETSLCCQTDQHETSGCCGTIWSITPQNQEKYVDCWKILLTNRLNYNFISSNFLNR